MNIIIEILLLTLGLSLLSLSIPRHYKQVTRKKQIHSKTAIWVLRSLGFFLLVLALILAMAMWGTTLGSIYYLATITLVSMLITLMLSFNPHWLPFIYSNNLATLIYLFLKKPFKKTAQFSGKSN